MLGSLLLALAPSLPLAAPQDLEGLPEGHRHPVVHLVRLELEPRQLAGLGALDLDVVEVDRDAGTADVVVTPEELERLTRLGLRSRVVTRDLAAFYARRLASGQHAPAGGPYGAWLSPPFGQGSMGGYYTLAELESVLDQMRAVYPLVVQHRISLGQSIQGRDLWMVKLSDNPLTDEGEAEARFDALHHAREPEGMQATLWFMLYLLEEYGTDPLATYLLEERELFFVPCVNPDGYEYNRSIAPGGGGMWRKNRRNNGGGSFGVDLNRNYPYNWGFDDNGSSGNPDSETYRGTGPASEPEVQGMVAFQGARQFNTALSVHTYGGVWLSPWGYDTLYPPDWPAYDEVGTLATEVNGYEHGPASIVLYEANGVTIDEDYAQHGTLSWTPEIGGGGDGFWPPQSRIVPLAEENLLGFQRTALAAGAWVRVGELVLVDAGDGDGSYEGGETVELTALLRNTGMRASGSVDLTLTTASPNATVSVPNASAGSIASFSDGQNLTPLALDVHGGTPAGTVIPFTVTVTYEGWSQDVPGELVVGTIVTLAAYDFEAAGDQGWAVGAPNDATTGEWTRVDPRGTAAQPEDDHTPSGVLCWVTGQGSVGGSLGENDVDNGSTTLVSPVFDLDGLALPRISYWRWYSNDEGGEPNADVLQVDLSNDGGSSWVPAETVGPAGAESSGGWFQATLDVASILTPTSQVRVRFVASDLAGGSIVEAALDDVEVTYLEGDSCNPPTNYCIGAANSVGPGASMGWSGSTDVNDASFDLLATGAIPNQFGLFFYGPGTDQQPLGNGFLCIGGGFFRLPALQLDGAGAAQYPLDFQNLPNGGDIANGETWHFQFWYRDPMGGGAGYNFSDGLTVEFCD